MMWKVNIIGEEHVWYSEITIDKILNHIEHFCDKCPYAEVEEDVCNNYCLLDEIVQPIIKIIAEENQDGEYSKSGNSEERQ